MTRMPLTAAAPTGPVPIDARAPEPADSADQAQTIGSLVRTITRTITGPITGPVAALRVEQIADLFEIARSEVDAIQQLDDRFASLQEVQRAKALLRQVPPAKMRAALKLRAAALRGASA